VNTPDLLEHERRTLEEERVRLRRLELELRAGWHTVSATPAAPTDDERAARLYRAIARHAARDAA
jgi:hypothetical protein